MKNYYFLATFVAMCTAFCNSTMAVELGEYRLVDGIPAIVIYVDESGEHGLVMSATAHAPEFKKELQKGFSSKLWLKFKERCIAERGSRPDFEEDYLNMPAYSVNYKMQSKQGKYLQGLFGQTTGSGKENAKIIEDYCANNNLDMAICFPEQEWARALGDGWYIPGNDELELLAKFFQQPIGKEYHTSAFPLLKEDSRQVWYSFSPERALLGYTVPMIGWNIFVPASTISSTMVSSSWSKEDGNLSKINEEIVKKIQKGNLKAKDDGFYWFVAISNILTSQAYLEFVRHDGGGYLVAVKEF